MVLDIKSSLEHYITLPRRTSNLGGECIAILALGKEIVGWGALPLATSWRVSLDAGSSIVQSGAH